MKLSTNSAQLIFDAALKKGLEAKIISRRFNLLKISYKGKELFIKGTSFPVNSQPACFIANNKFLTKRVLRSQKIPSPRSWLVRTPTKAREVVISKNLFPCVLKPIKGGHGKKVFANIESLEEFNETLPLVFTEPGEKNILLEEFVKGRDYRLLVVGKKVSAVMERVPAHVVGDGKSNVRQLIKEFNQNPLVGKKYEKPLCRIKLNGEAKRNLKKQGKKMTYVPKKSEMFFLRQNANISTGGTGRDVTNEVDDKLKKAAVRAAEAVGMAITGVDIIYDKLTGKLNILELNDCPGIDIHHYPAMGKSQQVATDIVDFLFDKQLGRVGTNS